MAKTPQGIVDKVVDLARLAVSDKEHEAANAAHAACKLIRENEELFATPRKVVKPPPEGTTTKVHPSTAAHFVVEKMLRKDKLHHDKEDEGMCAACGEHFEENTRVLRWQHVTTHNAMPCREWWATFDFEGEEELPF